MLQSALKKVIGQETSQAGSLVAFDRLRFDFNFHRPLKDNEIIEIEGLINKWIGDATLLESKVMSLTNAKKAGAIAMFGEKYGEEVYILLLLFMLFFHDTKCKVSNAENIYCHWNFCLALNLHTFL